MIYAKTRQHQSFVFSGSLLKCFFFIHFYWQSDQRLIPSATFFSQSAVKFNSCYTPHAVNRTHNQLRASTFHSCHFRFEHFFSNLLLFHRYLQTSVCFFRMIRSTFSLGIPLLRPIYFLTLLLHNYTTCTLYC